MPPATVTIPENVLAPDRVSVPVPALVRAGVLVLSITARIAKSCIVKILNSLLGVALEARVLELVPPAIVLAAEPNEHIAPVVTVSAVVPDMPMV